MLGTGKGRDAQVFLEGVATYKAGVSKCFGDGALLNLYRRRSGAPLSTVGGVDFFSFLTEDLTILEIEHIASCVGEDAAIGLALHELEERGEKVDHGMIRTIRRFLTPIDH